MYIVLGDQADYVPISRELTFGPTVQRMMVSIRLIDNPLFEDTEVIQCILFPRDNDNAVLVNDPETSVVIVDDDRK